MNEPHREESGNREFSAHPVLACLGVASRFRLVRALAVADRCVGELARTVGLSQSCTTRHLQALERVGLVKGRREGRRVRFRLRSETPGLSELLGWALSGSGREAPTVGAGPRPNQDAVRTPPAKAGRAPKPDRPIKATRPARREEPRGGSGSPPVSDAESVGQAGQSDQEAVDPLMVTEPRPTRRTGDLEDYLL
jgi:DNA-binding transcriptional ArsR family regulator